MVTAVFPIVWRKSRFAAMTSFQALSFAMMAEFNSDVWSLQPMCDVSCQSFAPFCGDSVRQTEEVCDHGRMTADMR